MADGLITTLSKLLQEGSVAWSAVSATQERALRPLREGGVLVRERSGAGERLVVTNAGVLRRFAEQRYPSGLSSAMAADQQAEALSPADGVRHFRDAKRGRQQADVLLFRGRPGSSVRCNGAAVPVGQQTATTGVAAVVLEAGRRVSMNGTLAIIENQTAFLQAEALGVTFDVALYGGGRLSGRVIEWLASPAMRSSTLVHCPDYDPVGLQEYEKLRACCGSRVRLHCPSNLEDLLQRYGKPSLYTKNRALLASMNNAASETRAVAKLLERYGCGLEQEVLIGQKREA
jgi:hypothetical protein